MSLWLLIVLFGLIKLPIAAMMLVLPFRNDPAMSAQDPAGSSDEDGGSRTLPYEPHGPRPRWPVSPRPRGPHHGNRRAQPASHGRSRGAHGAPAAPAPRRVRSGVRRRTALPSAR
jgi:hypothetical protein